MSPSAIKIHFYYSSGGAVGVRNKSFSTQLVDLYLSTPSVNHKDQFNSVKTCKTIASQHWL